MRAMPKVIVLLVTLHSIFAFPRSGPVDDSYMTCRINDLFAAVPEIQDKLVEFELRNSVEEVETQIEFHLLTRLLRGRAEVFRMNGRDRKYRSFNPNKKTILAVHGWMEDLESDFYRNITQAYMNNDDVNLILVDWTCQAKADYFTSRIQIPRMGRTLAVFIEMLSTEYGLDPGTIHAIGHSLGAHIIGIAGLYIKTGKLGKITGLDPALPYFCFKDWERLRPESANYVKVVHTCGEVLGILEPVGHSDFYPNGGTSNQPGCGLRDIISMGMCSHERSYLLFAQSVVHPSAFLTTRCDSWNSFKSGQCDDNKKIYMNDRLTNEVGSYYFTTTNKPPYTVPTERWTDILIFDITKKL